MGKQEDKRNPIEKLISLILQRQSLSLYVRSVKVKVTQKRVKKKGSVKIYCNKGECLDLNINSTPLEPRVSGVFRKLVETVG